MLFMASDTMLPVRTGTPALYHTCRRGQPYVLLTLLNLAFPLYRPQHQIRTIFWTLRLAITRMYSYTPSSSQINAELSQTAVDVYTDLATRTSYAILESALFGACIECAWACCVLTYRCRRVYSADGPGIRCISVRSHTRFVEFPTLTYMCSRARKHKQSSSGKWVMTACIVMYLSALVHVSLSSQIVSSVSQYLGELQTALAACLNGGHCDWQPDNMLAATITWVEAALSVACDIFLNVNVSRQSKSVFFTSYKLYIQSQFAY